MKLAATIARLLDADLQAELRDIERAVASSTREAGRASRPTWPSGCERPARRLADSWREALPERFQPGLHEGAADYPRVP
jgi:hypothetical protein